MIIIVNTTSVNMLEKVDINSTTVSNLIFVNLHFTFGTLIVQIFISNFCNNIYRSAAFARQ